MKCIKCNKTLPDDSLFCHFCGNKVKKSVEESTENNIFDNNINTKDISCDEVLNTIFNVQAKNTVETMEKNFKDQPDNECDVDFGLVPEKPIFTLALLSVDGEIDYLDSLYTTDGEKIKYNRRGSMYVENINGMVDVYDVFLQSGLFYKTIYINMYGAKKSTKAPVGFVINNDITQNNTEQNELVHDKMDSFNQYCVKTGGSVSKDKNSFSRKKINKSAFVVIAISLVLVTSLIINIYQYFDKRMMAEQKEYWINEANVLQDEVSGFQNLAEFVDNYVAFIEDDGTKNYHKFGCSEFKGEAFWIYNTQAAQKNGYSACPYCH